jgi:hypothetical protein
VSGGVRAAQFKPLEPELTFTLELVDDSNVRLSGTSKYKITKATSIDCTCQFSFIVPLSETKVVAASLSAIAKAYPVRGVLK